MTARAFAFSGSRHVAVGEGGAIAYSDDGQSWHSVGLVETSLNFNDVAYGGGTFVAIGQNGSCFTSSDGIGWTRQVLHQWRQLNAITWTGSRFVTVGDNGLVITSTNGVAWTPEPSGTTEHLTAVSSKGGILEAAGTKIFRSASTAIWTQTSTGNGYPVMAIATGTSRTVAYSNGPYYYDGGAGWTAGIFTVGAKGTISALATNGSAFVGVGSSYACYSADGISWQQLRMPGGSPLVDVRWTGDAFEGICANRARWTSPDGLHWSAQSLKASLDIVSTGDSQIAVGSSGLIATSTDGITWTSEISGTLETLHGVCWNGSRAVAVGAAGTVLWSDDMHVWNRISLGPWTLYDVAWGRGRFTAVGADGVVFTSPNGQAWETSDPGGMDAVTWDGGRLLAFRFNNVFTSTDGNKWTHIATAPWSTWGPDSASRIKKILWNGTIYVAVGDDGWRLSSPDGLNWTASNSAAVFEDWTSVAWSGSSFLAVGTGGYPNMISSSLDGIHWTDRANPNPSNLSAQYTDVIWSGTEWIVCGTNELSRSSNGTTWANRAGGSGSSYLAFDGVVRGNGIVVAYAYKTQVSNSPPPVLLISTSGGAWVQKTLATTKRLKGMAWNGATFVATFADGSHAVSANGTDWQFSAATSPQVKSLFAWDGSLWHRFSDTADSDTSADGVTWTAGVSRGGAEILRDLTYRGDTCIATGKNRVIVNTSGDEWTGYFYPYEQTTSTISNITVHENKFVMDAGAEGTFQSQDGLVWTLRSESNSSTFLASSGDTLIGTTSTSVYWDQGGSGMQLATREIETTMTTVARINDRWFGYGTGGTEVSDNGGRTWTRLGDPPDTSGNLFPIRHGGALHVLRYEGGHGRSLDGGENWEKMGGTAPATLAMASNGTRWVRLGPRGLYATTDGEEWTFQAVPDRSGLSTVAWTGTEFIASGASASYRSVDGISWTANPATTGMISLAGINGQIIGMSPAVSGYMATTIGTHQGLRRPFRGDLQGITSSPGIHVSSRNGIWYSTDLLSWNQATNLVNPASMIWTGSRFVAVSSSSGGYSTDGINWTYVSQARGQALAWTGSQVFSFGSPSEGVRRSADGATWISLTSDATEIMVAATWAGNFGLAVGYGGKFLRSTTGESWVQGNMGIPTDLKAVAWNGTKVVAVGTKVGIVTSVDGLAWQVVPGFGTQTFKGVCAVGRVFHAVNRDGQIYRSEDGTLWTKVFDDPQTGFEAVCWTGSGYVASGLLGTLVTSVDGLSWTLVSRGVGSMASARNFGSAFDNYKIAASPEPRWVAVDGNLISSVNGQIWHEEDATGGPYQEVTWTGKYFVAVGQNGVAVSPNGKTWNHYPSPTSEILFRVAGDGDSIIATAGTSMFVSKPSLAPNDSYEKWSLGIPEGRDMPTDDADDNGLSNFLDYAFGAPAFPGTGSTVRSKFPKMDGSAVRFTLGVERWDVRYDLQTSTNLSTWTTIGQRLYGAWQPTSAGTSISESPGIGGVREIRLTQTPAVARKFYRVNPVKIKP